MIFVWLWEQIVELVRVMGRFTIFAIDAVIWTFRPPYRLQLIINEMDFIGNQSLFIVGLTGIFTGAVFAYQLWMAFIMVGTDSLVVSMMSLALVRELAPIMTSIVVAGRAGAAMAAQIGIMRVTEQIDALEVMAIVPQQYLVGPKIVAAAIATPLLTAIFALIGTLGGYFVAVVVCHVDPGVSVNKLLYYLAPWDFFHGLIKAAIFGVLLAAIGCYKGYRARNGAAGVGKATNESVVFAIVTILVLDYFLSVIIPTGRREPL
ncbi:MAG: ABC transporter permease [Bdellovibrionales bacterium]|nr:ABC transporter permease [Bdellovibrionales bacterium]